MLNFKQISITSLIIALLIAPLNSQSLGKREPRKIQSFDLGWRFYAGDIKGAENPKYNDSSWLKVNVPHDWSIEGLAHSEAKVEEATELPVVRGEWKFNKGDDTLWKNPKLNDSTWQNREASRAVGGTFKLHRGQRVRLVPPRTDHPCRFTGKGHRYQYG